MKKAGKYAVVSFYSFDPDVSVVILPSYKTACKYMEEKWQDIYNTELAKDPAGIDEKETYHEENCAQIKWHDGDMFHLYVAVARKP